MAATKTSKMFNVIVLLVATAALLWNEKLVHLMMIVSASFTFLLTSRVNLYLRSNLVKRWPVSKGEGKSIAFVIAPFPNNNLLNGWLSIAVEYSAHHLRTNYISF